MKQLALDLGLAPPPSLAQFHAGPNAAALQHLRLMLASAAPVPTYLWGEAGSGKTHLLQAVRADLQERGASVGWLAADTAAPPAFDEGWDAVLLDDVLGCVEPGRHGPQGVGLAGRRVRQDLSRRGEEPGDVQDQAVIVVRG